MTTSQESVTNNSGQSILKKERTESGPKIQNLGNCCGLESIGAPNLGSTEGSHPICSDFPVSFRFVPICDPCFRGCPDFLPMCSNLHRFLPICFQNKSEQIREPLSVDLFCKARSLKNYQYSTEAQKLHQNSAPVLAIISGNSLGCFRKLYYQYWFYPVLRPDASAPAVVNISLPQSPCQ